MVDSNREGRELALRSRQVQTFYRVNRFISSIYNLDDLLDLIMLEAVTAVEAEASCIALHHPEENLLRIEFASGEAVEGVKHLTVAMGQGILGHVASTGKALRVDDVRQDSRFDPSADRRTGFITRSVLAVPIPRRNEVLGVLEVINKRGGSAFTEDDALLLEVVASQAAVAIENCRLFEQKIQSQQLAVIGRMAASIIHDLKQPMAVIRGFAELLSKPEIDPERRKTFSDMILDDVDRFQGMIQGLLDYAQGSVNLQPNEVLLGEWLDAIAGSLSRELVSAKVELVTRLDYRGPVWIDRDRMRRVISNIAANAADAMPGGGLLTIATRSGDGYWELEMEDTGTGIPSELIPRIFEPFVTSGKEFGTGLGLAIVRGIVEGHGGSIQVDSRVAGEASGRDSGTVFTIRMPTRYPTEC